MSRTIYIVRHGNTFDKGDTVTRVGARTDLPLSSSGVQQAKSLAEYFAAADVQFSRVFSSPLQRTRQTADAINVAQKSPKPVEFLEFLREIDYGVDENRPEPEVVNRIGQAALDRWESSAVVPDGWLLDTQALIRAWTMHFSQLVTSSDDIGPVLMVTSNGIARFALQIASQPVAQNFPLKLSTGAYGVLELNTSGRITAQDWNVRP